MKLTVYTDGGARGNPGPAAIGVVITADNKPFARIGKTIGETTNNVAEYTAVIEAYSHILSHLSSLTDLDKIEFFLDSNLVVNQLNGLFKVKDADLRLLFARIKILEQEVGKKISYTYIPREQNKIADALVNNSLDNS